MILSGTINKSIPAELELDFTQNTWSLPPAMAKWGGAMFSDRGLFEVKPWGVIWLMDGLGNAKKDSTVILHDAPTSEQDFQHESGGGRVYAPAKASFRDAGVEWRILRRAAPLALVSTGSLTKIREKAKRICEGLLPPHGRLTNGKPEPGAGGKDSACGEFPGRVLRRMPVLGPPYFRGAFTIDLPGAGPVYLTSPITQWEELSKAIDAKYKPARKTWVDFNGSNRPQTGDIYLLSQYENQAMFQHVGMIISATGNEWVTADGGQGNGWSSGFVKRKFHASGQIDGEFGKKAWVKGWVDLDNLREVLSEYFPADLK